MTFLGKNIKKLPVDVSCLLDPGKRDFLYGMHETSSILNQQLYRQYSSPEGLTKLPVHYSKEKEINYNKVESCVPENGQISSTTNRR